MARFAIRYEETYAGTYFVEATSLKSAMEILDECLRSGEVDGPEFCSDSTYEDITESLDSDITDEMLDVRE